MDPRGELPPLPPAFDDITTVTPIDAGDAGRPVNEVVGELEDDLFITPEAVEWRRSVAQWQAEIQHEDKDKSWNGKRWVWPDRSPVYP